MEHKCLKRKWNSGFSLVEVLATVAILVILLGVSGVAAAYYKDYLKITELDNAAREIYMAAENRAVLLSGSRQLKKLLDPTDSTTVGTVDLPEKYFAAGTTQTAEAAEMSERAGDPSAENPKGYYILSSTVGAKLLGELLPTGTIDPTLLTEGEFCVVYEPESGCVTDVFYAEKPDGVGNIDAAYSVAEDREARMGRKPELRDSKLGMLGYYGGGIADSIESRYLTSPGVNVLIHNDPEDERLWMEVRFTVPSDVLDDPDLEFEPTVTLTCGKNIQLMGDFHGISMHDFVNPLYANRQYRDEEIKKVDKGSFNGKDTEIVRAWVLDSLEENKHFRDFDPSSSPFNNALGGEFTVTATLTLHTPDASSGTATASARNNSLFAESSSGGSAVLENLRHLQNLDTRISGVGTDVKAADQASEIDCGTYREEAYVFTPIENDALESYTVRASGTDSYVLNNLKVLRGKVGDRGGAGLFAVSPKNRVEGVRLVNASVEGGNVPTGTLAGQSGTTAYKDCQVYWKTGWYDYPLLLGKTEMDDNGTDGLFYDVNSTGYPQGVVTTGNAGGLVGEVTGSASFTECLAATLVRGSNAGGLVGSGKNVSVNNSYADCYIRGSSTAAGLIGSASGSASVTTAYAAGFIDAVDKPSTIGGILTGVNTTAQNTYSVMSNVRVKEGTADVTATSVTGSTYFYLGGSGATYERMTSNAFITNGLNSSAFEFKGQADSHPYNINGRLKLTKYDFPGLKGLPHYGDWAAQFKEPSLVYYETYEDNETLFSGGNANILRFGKLDDGKQIALDGYAVAFLQGDLKGNSARVTGQCMTADGSLIEFNTETYNKDTLVKASWEGQVYYLIPLPDDLIKAAPKGNSFYQYLKFNLDLGDGSYSEGESFFNPHFADSVIPYAADTDASADGTAPTTVEWTPENITKHSNELLDLTNCEVFVRTPRHLYDLSQYEFYHHYADSKRQLNFRQVMDLDYSKYNWSKYGLTLTDNRQAPIGPGPDETKSFNGVYDGGSRFIRNVRFTVPEGSTTGSSYAGLFGVSTGRLKNIVYDMYDKPETGNASAVTDSVGLSGGKTLYLGALVGQNDGEVENCAVTDVEMKAVVSGTSTLYLGGLVGENLGSINNSAAEADSLDAAASSYSHVYAAGFVGQNASSGRISSSYAVGMVSTEGDQTSQALSCGFAGQNAGGAVSGSYAAARLLASYEGAHAYGFCGGNSGSLGGSVYLNEGNFTYNGKAFAASYDEPEGGAKSINYDKLIDNPFSGGMSLKGGIVPEDADYEAYPYPTGVKNGSHRAVHYGGFPKPMDLKDTGVYYWEQMSNKEYRFTVLAVDLQNQTVTRQSTLSTSHDEGLQVVRYGYGYYSELLKNEDGTVADGEKVGVKFTSDGLLYYAHDGKTFTGGGSSAEFGAQYETIDKWKANASENSGSAEDKAADEGLKALMPDYGFHSFHSYGLREGSDGADPGGLYPREGKQNGTLTLTADGKTLTFRISPLFAEALSVRPETGWTVTNKVDDGVDCTLEPGTAQAGTGTTGEAKANPYGVRSMAQLKMINWYNSNYSKSDRMTNVVANSNNYGYGTTPNFPYLNSSIQETAYHWKQTYDVTGETGELGEGTRTYTPIAEYYDTYNNGSSGSGSDGLNCWFGGEYDGGNYKIQDMTIVGQESSCAGLFGVTFKATLKNIILHSSTGTGKISAGPNVYSHWYAIGPLAGLVGDGSVTDCSASGYTVDANTITNWGGYGGGLIGGLVGAYAGDRGLTRCSAVTKINIQGAKERDNMRVGGLAGTCQGILENCYAGGEILLEQNSVEFNGDCGIYVGGLVGGSYLSPLTVNTSTGKPAIGKSSGKDTNNTFISCYSYVKLPKKDAHEYLKGLYMIGGTGEINPPDKYKNDNKPNHGEFTIINCYYLESEVLANNIVNGKYDKEGIYDKFKADPDNGNKTDHGVKTDLPGTGGTLNIGDDLDSLQGTQKTMKQLDSNTYYYRVSGYRGNSRLFFEYGDDVYICNPDGDFDLDTMAGCEVYVKTTSGWGTNRKTKYKFYGWVVSYSTRNRILTITQDNPNQSDETETTYLTSFAVPYGLTHAQLAGEEKIPVKVNGADTPTLYTIYQLLNGDVSVANKTVAPAYTEKPDDAKTKGPTYYPVTTKTSDGVAVSGKYSYPPSKTHAHLVGLDYPFPTVLSRQENGETVHVHYGQWPVNGIERFKDNTFTEPLGGSSITLDLFSDSTRTEYLRLSDDLLKTIGNKPVTWTVTVPQEKQYAIESSITGNGHNAILTVTGKNTDSCYLQVTCAVDGKSVATLSIFVVVSKELSLQPAVVRLFPGDEVDVELKPYGKEVDGVATPMDENNLTLTGTNSSTNDFLTATNVEDKARTVKFTTKPGGVPDSDPVAQIGYTYGEHTGSSPVRASIIELTPSWSSVPDPNNSDNVLHTAMYNFGALTAEDGTPLDITLGRADFDGTKPALVKSLNWEEESIYVEYESLSAPAEGEEPELPPVTLKVTLTMTDQSGTREHNLTIPVTYVAPVVTEALAEVQSVIEAELAEQAEPESPVQTEAVVPEAGQEIVAGRRRRAVRHLRRRRAGKP